MHPEEILTAQQIQLVKKSLLVEMDKGDKNCPTLKFVATDATDGWLSITCHDTETKKWLMSAVGRIKPWKSSSLRITQGNEVPKLFTCVTFVPEEDLMTKDVFLSRIARQNTNVCTKGWRVLRITKEKSGGETITFSVDEKSKDYILSQGCKLFLNFSQVHIRMKGLLKPVQSNTPEAITEYGAKAHPKFSAQQRILDARRGIDIGADKAQKKCQVAETLTTGISSSEEGSKTSQTSKASEDLSSTPKTIEVYHPTELATNVGSSASTSQQ